MRVLGPIAEINQPTDGKPRRLPESLTGKRIGLLWGRHAASIKFWPVLEEVVELLYRPTEVHRLYKESTWNAARPERRRHRREDRDQLRDGRLQAGVCPGRRRRGRGDARPPV